MPAAAAACSFFLAVALVACSRTAEPPLLGRDAAAAAPSDPACGELACETFPSAAAAFARVLADDPRVLAVGESHAWTGDTGDSPSRRFVDALLPLLEGRARALVVELWVADGSCRARAPREVAAVTAKQREVGENQAPKSQSDFLALYEGARRHGLRARLLVPPCETYGAIADAGPRDVDTMLTMIADVTARDVSALLAEHPDGTIVTYGGAMHNDLAPRPGHARWSFGPRLAAATAGRYVELDLVVPENVHDTDATRAQPWYAHYRRAAQGARALLLHVRPGSYALVFPPRADDGGGPKDGGP